MRKRLWTSFINKLAFYKLPKLVLRLATMTKKRNVNYNHIMACFNNLEQSAVRFLNEGIYDYNDDITCPYHNLEEPSEKMHMCCRNVVLRRIYLILNGFVRNLNLRIKDSHMIEKFGPNKVANRRVDVPTGDVRAPTGLAPGAGRLYQPQLPLSAIPRAQPPPDDTEGSSFLNAAWGK